METFEASRKPLGPTGRRVADNARRLRDGQGISVRALSERLGALGRPILPSGITKIEQGARRVDVDDLIALALALGVNPSALLLPAVSEEESVELTPGMSASAWATWQWADGLAPLPTRPGDDEDDPYNTSEEHETFHRASRPPAMRRAAEHPLIRAADQLRGRLLRVLHHAGKPVEDPTRASVIGFARRALDRVASELDDVVAGG